MTLITAALVFLAIVRSNAFEFWDPAVDFPQLNTYFNNDFIGDSFSRLQQTYPDLVRTSSLGKTPGDNDINEITITSNVSNWETANKPSVKYVANMHGNEIRGRGLLLKLAHYLVIKYKDDKDVKELVDTTVFHLLPTINPDGFDGAAQSCSSVTGRYTSDGTDMNRDFPSHWFDGKRLKFAEETKMIMSYADQVPAVLGISFHDGALVANYPWDGKPDLPSGKYAASPDDSVFINLAKTYSLNHKNMYKTSAQCGHDAFQDGITNGNKWYKVFNGMQDWNYYYHDCFELTVELGCCKYPEDAASTFGDVWSDNFNSVLAYTKLTNYGIKGQVTNFKGNPITGVTITVSGVNKTIKVRHQQGYYWRPLLAGTYNVSASKKGYYTLHRRNVVVREGESTDVSFILISKSQVRARKRIRRKRFV